MELLSLIISTFQNGDILMGLYQTAVGIVCLLGGGALWFYIIIIGLSPLWVPIVIVYKIYNNRIHKDSWCYMFTEMVINCKQFKAINPPPEPGEVCPHCGGIEGEGESGRCPICGGP